MKPAGRKGKATNKDCDRTHKLELTLKYVYCKNIDLVTVIQYFIHLSTFIISLELYITRALMLRETSGNNPRPANSYLKPPAGFGSVLSL